MKIGYLCSHDVITTSRARRADAFEHDLEYFPIKAALEARGASVKEVDWRQMDLDHSPFDVLLVRTVWDYTDHLETFRAFVDKASLTHLVLNDPKLVHWNCSKRYLGQMAADGLAVIPSFFPSQGVTANTIFDHFDCEDIVVKRVVGAGGFHQRRYIKSAGHGDEVISPEDFAQPFMPQIIEEGELSFIYFAGRFSHAVIKDNPSGEYRIQSLYGGRDQPYTPTQDELSLIDAYMAALPAPALAVRVDVIRDGDRFLLMEFEAIEPYLYPEHVPDFGGRFAEAVFGMVERQS